VSTECRCGHARSQHHAPSRGARRECDYAGYACECDGYSTAERRVCSAVMDNDCRAPAGYLIGSGSGSGGVADGSGSTRATCTRCGEPVCTSAGCSRRLPAGRVCVPCIEGEAHRAAAREGRT